MKVTTVTLPYGVAFGRDRKTIRPAGEALTTYRLDLLEPVDGITAITVRAATLGDAIDVQAKVTAKFQPGTTAFADAIYRAHLERRTDPVLTPKQITALSGPDQDALRALVEGGYDPDGKRAHKGGSDLEREAFARLHFGTDRKRVEQALPISRSDNPMLYEAKLVHLVTRFGPPREEAFAEDPVEWLQFINIAFADYVALSMAIAGRDYKELAEILDGPVEVGGETLPFPGAAETGAQGAHQEG